MNALTVVFAALCIFAIGYRFYGLFIANKVLNLNDARVTPAVKYSDGHDYVDTNKYVLFGHHFAAIAAAGPLLGPVLAAQFGYMPGLLWILIGCVLAGGVHDMVVLFASVRHRGQSLAYIASQEIDKTTGSVAAWAVLAILLLTLAGLSIAVVNAMHNSLWSTYTVAATIPIAIIMGLYMQIWRKGDVLGASIIGVVLLALCILTGPYVAAHPETFGWLDIDKKPMSILIPVYGFAASVLPVWMLLLPRDYLSTFLKIGTIGALALGIVFVMPDFNMPAFTEFTKGGGPIVGGPVIPFIFITIACGALSGFHATIGTGTTPKMIGKERDVLFVGYGAMLVVGFVAIMALIAACVLVPADYFAINAPADKFAALGMSVVDLPTLEKEVAESLMHRPGGSVSLAVGMAHIFGQIPWMAHLMSYWYHFAIMFEALFILTALDAGTRSGRFMLQDLLGNFIPFLKKTDSLVAGIIGTAGCVGLWGYLLYQGVVDPLGGVKSLWPLFGISNQMLAAVALVLGTVVLIKMKRTQYIWVTVVPAVWLLICTTWALGLKLFSTNPQMEGFFYMASQYKEKIANGTDLTAQQIANMNHIVVNNYTNAGLSILFLIVVYSIIFYGFKTWLAVRNSDKRTDKETPYVPIPEGGVKISSHH